jgi:hypothetical protein
MRVQGFVLSAPLLMPPAAPAATVDLTACPAACFAGDRSLFIESSLRPHAVHLGIRCHGL